MSIRDAESTLRSVFDLFGWLREMSRVAGEMAVLQPSVDRLERRISVILDALEGREVPAVPVTSASPDSSGTPEAESAAAVTTGGSTGQAPAPGPVEEKAGGGAGRSESPSGTGSASEDGEEDVIFRLVMDRWDV